MFERFLGAEIADGCTGGGEDTIGDFPCRRCGLFSVFGDEGPGIQTIGKEMVFFRFLSQDGQRGEGDECEGGEFHGMVDVTFGIGLCKLFFFGLIFRGRDPEWEVFLQPLRSQGI